MNLKGGFGRFVIWVLILNLSLVYLSFGTKIKSAKADSILGRDLITGGSLTGNISVFTDSKNRVTLSSSGIKYTLPTGYELDDATVGLGIYDYVYTLLRNDKETSIEPPGIGLNSGRPTIYSKTIDFKNVIDVGANNNLEYTYSLYLQIASREKIGGKFVLGLIGPITGKYSVGLAQTTSDGLSLLEPTVIQTGLPDTNSSDKTTASVRFSWVLTGESFNGSDGNICSMKIKKYSDNSLNEAEQEYSVSNNDKCNTKRSELPSNKIINVELDVGSESNKVNNYFYAELQYWKKKSDKERTVLQSDARNIAMYKDKDGNVVADVWDAGTSLEQLAETNKKQSELTDAEECLGAEGPFNFFKKGLCAVMTMIIDIAIGVSAWAFGYLQGAINGL